MSEMNQTERLLTAAADHIAATLEQPSDMRAWEQLLIYCPRTGAKQMSDAIAALAKRFWSVLPREIQDLGITREQYYEREMRALFATSAARIEVLEARLDRAVTRGLEQVERIAALEAAMRQSVDDWRKQRRRIATLEAALREIADAHPIPPLYKHIARAALAEGQDK